MQAYIYTYIQYLLLLYAKLVVAIFDYLLLFSVVIVVIALL